MAASNAERQAALRARRLRSGMDQLRAWVRAETKRRLAKYMQDTGQDHDAALASLLDMAERKQ